MSRWFRAYDSALDDPKVQRLSDALFRTWFNILCVASKSGGQLPGAEDVSFMLRLSVKETEKRLSALVDAGLIDGTETGLRPHNWDARQFKSDVSNERVKRFRERSAKQECNVTSAVTVTPPETETDTEQSVSLRSTDGPREAGPSTEKPKRSAVKGSRVPEDFKPDETSVKVGLSLGIAAPVICGECVAEFLDYWRGITGSKGVKSDWQGAFRNRLRAVAGRFANQARGSPRSTNGFAAVAAELEAKIRDRDGLFDDNGRAGGAGGSADGRAAGPLRQQDREDGRFQTLDLRPASTDRG